MTRRAWPVAAFAAIALLILWPVPDRRVRELPAGTVELHTELEVAGGTELRGARAGTVLRLAADFQGRAAIVVRGSGVLLRGFTVDGNREALAARAGLPPSNVAFENFTRANGVLAAGVGRFTVEDVSFRGIAGFAVLVSRARDVAIARVRVTDSGSRDAAGANNTTGGILLEEGTDNFSVSGCLFRRVLGNGVWTHARYGTPRNARGLIAGNIFEEIGRDAIQVGHATRVRVEGNTGARIGFPVDAVDIGRLAIPVAIDTAGDVDHSVYAGNSFAEVDGKCIDLDGFHDGEVRGNTCSNRGAADDYPYGGFGIVMNNSNPDMRSRNIRIEDNTIAGARLGGIFVIGSGHRIVGNRLLNLNTAHCNDEMARFPCYYAPGEPDMLRSGIYLGRGAERPAPARGNTVEDNEITGYKMDTRCVGHAPGVRVEDNVVRGNRCRER